MKKITIILGVISLIIGLKYANTDFNTFFIFFIIFSCCFIHSRKEIFKIVSRPIIKRIIILNKREKRILREISLLEEQQQNIDNIEINKYVEDINKLKNIKKELNVQIIKLEDKRKLLEQLTKQEQIVEKAFTVQENSFNILLEKNEELKKQRNSLKKELTELTKIIVPTREKINFANKYSDLENIDGLTGIEFEEFIADLLKYLGYEYAETTQESGDYGIDVIAIKDDIKYGIQCKNYAQPVGNKAIQEAYSGKTYYNCHVAIVITNSYFTSNAIKQAEKSNVVLWDRSKLEEIVKRLI